jgi:hypothetical protein
MGTLAKPQGYANNKGVGPRLFKMGFAEKGILDNHLAILLY